MSEFELAIFREELTKAAAENLHLRSALAEKVAMLAEKDGKIADLKKYAAAARAAGADAAAALGASRDARLSALLEDSRRMREELAAPRGATRGRPQAIAGTTAPARPRRQTAGLPSGRAERLPKGGTPGRRTGGLPAEARGTRERREI